MPAPGIDARLKQYFAEKGTEGTAHVLVQFDAMPANAKREALAKGYGLRLLHPVPERAFFASIPADFANARKLAAGEKSLRFIGTIQPEDKVSPSLSGDVPPHARRENGAAELVVEFFGDVPLATQEKILRHHGVKPVHRIEPLNGWLMVMDVQRIRGLAQEDATSWIVEGPPPQKVHNDEVRAESGVHADSVLSSATPPNLYGLGGSGVVIMQTEWPRPNAGHPDLQQRVTVAGRPLDCRERPSRYVDANQNAMFDGGEPVYLDVDDSSTVSVGDRRLTPAGSMGAGTTVSSADPDLTSPATALRHLSWGAVDGYPTPVTWHGFRDTSPADGCYSAGEAVYEDLDRDRKVSVGDRRLTPVATPAGTYTAGTGVAAGDADVGGGLWLFSLTSHGHATHVAATAVGTGVNSAAGGGTAQQWKGVAAQAKLRADTWSILDPAVYGGASANGVAITTNSWSTIFTCSDLRAPVACYDVQAQFLDAVSSGRPVSATEPLARMLIVQSAGNDNHPERHTENVAANGRYDAGETIYVEGSYGAEGQTSADDRKVTGPDQPIATALVNFAADEMHTSATNEGIYSDGDAIYRDADMSRSVTAGDTRLAVPGFTAGSTVQTGDADVGSRLRSFDLWTNVLPPGTAKNTLQVGAVTSNTRRLAPFSSRGPTNDDGRLKPDVVGPGSHEGNYKSGVKSAWPPDGYRVMPGTSMAAPAVAGTAALVHEWYRVGCSSAAPNPEVLRALLVHGAEDLTSIPGVSGMFAGPDFSTGYGRVRAKESVDLVPHHVTGTIAINGQPAEHKVTIGATQALKVTLVWDDPPWNPGASPSLEHGILQNDLDLVVVGPDGTQYSSWSLTPDNPFAPASLNTTPPSSPVPAQHGDHRNTIEQVLVPNAAPGTWTIRVTSTQLALPPQSYAVVSEALPTKASPCAFSQGADVWMKDNEADTGTVPATGALYVSPDVWNRLAADGGANFQNPVHGQKNYLYANVRNAGGAEAAATSVDFWVAPASLGLAWPAHFVYVGRVSVPHLRPGEVRKVGPLEWYPPDPHPSDHFCMYVRADSPQDPITLAETASVSTNTASSNNITWRNMNVVEASSPQTVAFQIRNLAATAADVDLVVAIEAAQKMPPLRTVVTLSPRLLSAWPHHHRKMAEVEPVPDDAGKFNVGAFVSKGGSAFRLRKQKALLRGFRLKGKQSETVSLTFSPDAQAGTYRVHVSERVHGKIVGGIVYIVRTAQTAEPAEAR